MPKRQRSDELSIDSSLFNINPNTFLQQHILCGDVNSITDYLASGKIAFQECKDAYLLAASEEQTAITKVFGKYLFTLAIKFGNTQAATFHIENICEKRYLSYIQAMNLATKHGYPSIAALYRKASIDHPISEKEILEVKNHIEHAPPRNVEKYFKAIQNSLCSTEPYATFILTAMLKDERILENAELTKRMLDAMDKNTVALPIGLYIEAIDTAKILGSATVIFLLLQHLCKRLVWATDTDSLCKVLSTPAIMTIPTPILLHVLAGASAETNSAITQITLTLTTTNQPTETTEKITKLASVLNTLVTAYKKIELSDAYTPDIPDELLELSINDLIHITGENSQPPKLLSAIPMGIFNPEERSTSAPSIHNSASGFDKFCGN